MQGNLIRCCIIYMWFLWNQLCDALCWIEVSKPLLLNIGDWDWNVILHEMRHAELEVKLCVRMLRLCFIMVKFYMSFFIVFLSAFFYKQHSKHFCYQILYHGFIDWRQKDWQWHLCFVSWDWNITVLLLQACSLLSDRLHFLKTEGLTVTSMLCFMRLKYNCAFVANMQIIVYLHIQGSYRLWEAKSKDFQWPFLFFSRT